VSIPVAQLSEACGEQRRDSRSLAVTAKENADLPDFGRLLGADCERCQEQAGRNDG